MATRMQQRRGTAAQWTSADPILAAGEIGFESDTGFFKMGDGINHWEDLSYFKDLGDLAGSFDDYVPLSQKGAANGVATLNADSQIPVAQLSAIIQGAPGALDTLNELANAITDTGGLVQQKIDAALGNQFIAGTGINLSYNAETQRLTVTAGATLATDTELSTAISDHNSATTNVHGISDTADLVTLTGTQTLTGKTLSAADNAITVNAADIVDVTASASELNILDGVTVSATSINYLSGLTDGVQAQLDTKLPLSGGTLTGKITLDGDPSSALHAATKSYVDNTASGIVAKPQVLGATTANIDATYSNGTAGVGATLTHNTNGVFPSEAGGASGWAVGKGILVKNQTNKAQNGRYYISNMGSVSTPYVLTRCTYCDEASEIPGAYIFVQDGANAGTGWIQVVEDPATFVVGTDNIDVFQFSGAGTITAGANISVSGNEVSVVATPSLSGVEFSDGTQTKQGVPSLTAINQQAAAYTTVLTDRDKLVEVSSASGVTVTIPTNASVAYPVGTSIDILQTGSGQVTIAAAGGVTVNATPGLKLRTQWSSATLFKRATDTWVVFGDLTA
jgi:hypothetical protein